MRKQKRIFLFVVFLILFMTQNAFATNFQKVEYSEDFVRWMELSEEEKKNVLQPRMYDIENTKVVSKNPFYKARTMKASLNTRYSLKDVIPENLVIRNQQDTYSCWAFAALSSLETNIALTNHKTGKNDSKVYDFSERHMEYATSKTFLNGVENEKGYNREVGDGGTWYMAQTYLTNGMGAIDETQMRFENNENQIDISQIQNKTVSSQVYDVAQFEDYSKQTEEKRLETIKQVKEHIQEYGSVYAAVHGNSSSTSIFSCYDNTTGAKYCSNSITHQADHAVSIIGWDDNYSVENFVKDSRPTSNGAWIIRNSWGERLEYDLAKLKERVFDDNLQHCLSQGWNSPERIPNAMIEELGYTIENDIAYVKIGDNGIMYVSYEDCNISKSLYGIEKATDTVNYENIYQYDDFFPGFRIRLDQSNFMLCNIFDKKGVGPEYLTQVSLYAPETYTCKVYVNPNGTSKAKKDMQLVSLKAGESETFQAGYHTIEFSKPVEIKGDSFAVLVEIQGTRENVVSMDLETKIDGLAYFDSVIVEDGKCFAASGNDLENCQWENLGRLSEQNSALPNGDSSLKAYTVSHIEDNSLKDIEIVIPPNKTTYFEGQNFDKTGMVIKANYNNNTSVELESSSYTITNGTNLKAGQTSVTITYEDKRVNQSITVEKNSVVELKIKTPPNKTAYKAGQNFDKTGMEIEATYKNGDKKVITDFIIENGTNLKENQTQVTVIYDEKRVEQPITVTQNRLLEIKITKMPDTTDYIVGQNFDKTGMIVTGIYEDGSKEEIINYTIENGTNLKEGQEFVIIEYEGKTVFQTIRVEKKVVEEISIDEKPLKLTYFQNKEGLDLTGGKLKITYSDGTTETIQMDSEQVVITGFDNAKLGKITLTITYQSKSTQLEIEIVEEKLENSDLANISCHVKKVDAYYFINKLQDDYTTIALEINGDFKDLGNTREYYYYLSSNQQESNIHNWIKVAENQKSTKQLQFVIDSRKVDNYYEIASKKVIFLYIKEVVMKDGNQSIAISKPMKLETEDALEVHITGTQTEVKPSNDSKTNTVNTTNDTKTTNTTNSTNKAKDNTVASKILPQTGSKVKIVIVISFAIITMIILLIKYKNLSQYVK